MNVENALKEVGLSDGESKVYLSLLKLGSSQVSKIKEDTKLHRTTIYDFLEKLLNKGLASYVVKNSVKYYSAAHPSKLVDFIKEKEENIRKIIPALEKISEFEKNEIKVEVYKGEEGFKTLLNQILRVKKEAVSFGVDEVEFRKRFPLLMEQFFNKEAKLGIKERSLTSEDAKFTYKKKNISYRYIPKEFFSPTPTIIFGNITATIIWDPLTIIITENAALAESHRLHFEMLWKHAKVKK